MEKETLFEIRDISNNVFLYYREKYSRRFVIGLASKTNLNYSGNCQIMVNYIL